jgi:membrane protease YdiL (CAAX protease family)
VCELNNALVTLGARGHAPTAQGAAIRSLQSAILRLDLRTRLLIAFVIEVAYMAASRVIYHYPGLTFAEVELWRTPLRLLAAGLFWLLMADVILAHERDSAPLRRPLLWFGMVFWYVAPAQEGGDAGDLLETILVCLATVPVALHEELFFRGILQSLLIKRVGAVLGIGTTSVLFVAYHIGVTRHDFINYVELALAGLVLGVAYARTGSLGLVVLFHALDDVLWSLPPPLRLMPLPWALLSMLIGACLVAIWGRRPQPRS